MQIYSEKGHVTDDIFEKLGFPMDSDPLGEKVRREAGITQESRQRSKILTHRHQCELRESNRLSIQSELQRKEREKQDMMLERIAMSKACDTKLIRLMNGDDIKNVSHEVLNSLLVEELKNFILVRDPSLTKSRLPKKGKVGDTI